MKNIFFKKFFSLALATILSLCTITTPLASAATVGQRIVQRQMVVSQMVEEVRNAYYIIRESLNTLIPTKMVVEGSIAAYNVDELIEESNLIAIGHFTGQSDTFRVQTIGGSIWIYTDNHFVVDNTLKGTPYGDTISVRTKGGTVGTYTQEWSHMPEFNQEDTYLLFLHSPGAGSGINPKGDYYYVRGLIQGVYILQEDGTYMDYLGEEELPPEALISPQMNEDLTEEDQRNELLETYRNNYETGFDTWEEYQKNLDELDQYAVILD